MHKLAVLAILSKVGLKYFNGYLAGHFRNKQEMNYSGSVMSDFY